MLTSMAALFAAAPAAAAQRGNDQELVDAVEELTQAVTAAVATSPELARIREQQRVFLKANQKYPDFMEVGLDVWESVYDWHVRHNLPIDARRSGDGRYMMSVMFTTLILRWEQAANYIGYGFDSR